PGDGPAGYLPDGRALQRVSGEKGLRALCGTRFGNEIRQLAGVQPAEAQCNMEERMMNTALAIDGKRLFAGEQPRLQVPNFLKAFKSSASLILIAAMFMAGSGVALALHIPVKTVMSNYSYDVLVILVVMELF